ncbi:MAG: DUF192 domain-containing protein [Deltaproteobacteria bacterium]|jgi:uncharacterized membrane protein (UPF0127 family)|nr:DUF192 domain-containing protein [Deltaproteobacteria bacterium]
MKITRGDSVKKSFGVLALVVAASFFNSQTFGADSPAPIFKKRKIEISGKTIVVEIADTDERRAHGLMFRNSLPKDEGMLFVFEDERPRSFWMKNTLIPLSIAYINKDKIITEVVDMQPAILGAARPKSYPSKKKSMYALEMNIGWFERNKIWPGVQFRYADKAP